jgi:hypothetical protein
MASSTEEVSGPMNDLSGGSRRDEGATEQFGVFKDFDFLEYESESVEVRISFYVVNVLTYYHTDSEVIVYRSVVM